MARRIVGRPTAIPIMRARSGEVGSSSELFSKGVESGSGWGVTVETM